MGDEVTSRTPNHRFPAPEEVRRHGHDESQSALLLGLVLGLPVRTVRPQPGKDKGSHTSAAPRLRVQVIAKQGKDEQGVEVMWVAFLTPSSSVPRVAGSAMGLRGQVPTTHEAHRKNLQWLKQAAPAAQ